MLLVSFEEALYVVADVRKCEVINLSCRVVMVTAQCYSFEHCGKSFEICFWGHVGYVAILVEDSELIVERSGVRATILLLI